jgi:endonuclease/exonuclease/phosphatase family metal-dependent hydrolase
MMKPMRRGDLLSKLDIGLPEIFPAVGLPALALVFGLQSIRSLVAGLTWTLGDTYSLGAPILGAVALLIFGASFLAGPLRRRLSYRHLILFSLGSLILFRLFLQFWHGLPLLTVVWAGLAVIALVIFLPIYLDEVRREGNAAKPLFAGGFLGGIVLDTLLYGGAGTYDLVWQQTPLPIIVTVINAGLLVGLVFKYLENHNDSASFNFKGKAGAWLAIGPFIFLQLIILQNIPALTTLTGWGTNGAFLWIIVSQAFGIMAAYYFHSLQEDTIYFITLFSAGILLTFSLFPYLSGWPGAILLFLGQIAASQLFFAIVTGMASGSRRSGALSLPISNGIGMTLLMVFILGYYASYQIALPYNNSILLALAAVLVAGGAMTSLRHMGPRLRIGHRQWSQSLIAVIAAVILPVALLFTTPAVSAGTDTGFPLRIATYNLHNGFSAEGTLNLEALALDIEESGADVVALQEISRGWLVSGRVDMLEWLSQRLNMPYYFGPSSGPFWGNAILSRYPIASAVNIPLPSEGLPLERSFIAAILEINGRNFQVIAVHLHHVADDSDIRVEQVSALLSFYGNTARTVIMGDFNAEPNDPEIKLMRAAGLRDVLLSIEPPPAYTFRSDDPFQRIDYIWVSPDLTWSEVSLTTGTASDHHGVIATVNDPSP